MTAKSTCTRLGDELGRLDIGQVVAPKGDPRERLNRNKRWEYTWKELLEILDGFASINVSFSKVKILAPVDILSTGGWPPGIGRLCHFGASSCSSGFSPMP